MGVPEKTCFGTACLHQGFVYRKCGVWVEARRGPSGRRKALQKGLSLPAQASFPPT